MVSVRKIGHVTLETPDLSREAAHYTDIVGLVISAKERDRIVLSTALGEEAVVLERGAHPRLRRLSLQVGPSSDLNEVKKQLGAAGVPSERASDITPSIADAVVLHDPVGTKIELFAATKSAPGNATAAGVVPLKLGHVAFMVPEAKQMADFYTEKLGFRVSDWMGDYFVFLRCGPDHHTVNFIDGSEPRVHHVAFELKDWAHVQTACEHLGRKDRKIIWGPGRHGVGHNIFIYHRDEDDHIVEFYIEMDQMKDEELGYFEPRPWHKDFPQRPKVWERGPAALTWGTPPTEEFLRSHFRREI